MPTLERYFSTGCSALEVPTSRALFSVSVTSEFCREQQAEKEMQILFILMMLSYL